jgi:hypothetical protein
MGMSKVCTASGIKYHIGAVAVLLSAAIASTQASAATYREIPVEQREAFKVCADPHNMPMSNDKREGFENKIAELFADAMGMEIEYYFFPQRLGFIRNSLRKMVDDHTYACDVVMTVPEDFDEGTPTIPYYRSQYVLVFQDSWEHSDKVDSPEDLINLPEDARDGMKIGVTDGGMGNVWVVRNGLRSHATTYQLVVVEGGECHRQRLTISVGAILQHLSEAYTSLPIRLAAHDDEYEAPDVSLVLPPPGHRFDVDVGFRLEVGVGEFPLERLWAVVIEGDGYKAVGVG